MLKEIPFKMKLSYLHFITLILLISCSESRDKISSEDSKVKINADSLNKIDSLKWYYYVNNHEGKAYFFDSLTKKQIALNPIECDATLISTIKEGKDSIHYFFSFQKNGLIFNTVKPLYYSGTKSYNNILYPMSIVTWDYEKNIDSLLVYRKWNDSIFANNLKNYKGKINNWLLNEAIKRGILARNL
jgi:hypothetical protein